MSRVGELFAEFRRSKAKTNWIYDQFYWRYFTYQHRKQALRNEQYDREHGVDTATELPLAEAGVDAGDVDRGNGVYRPLTEELFRAAMDSIRIDPGAFTFVDIGSGKGKVLLMAADRPFKRILGIEYALGLHEVAVRNVALYKSAQQRCKAIEALYGDALDYELPEGPLLLFIFNALARDFMAVLLKKLDTEAAANPARPVFLIYTNLRTVGEMGDIFEGLARLKPIRRKRNYIVLANTAADESLQR